MISVPDDHTAIAAPPIIMAHHQTTMREETLSALDPRDDGIYIDATFGAGGLTTELLERAACRVIAIDRDPVALATAHALALRVGNRLCVAPGCFSNLAALLDQLQITKIDGIVFDLGVASFQIDTPERGFSFLHDGPLDMRMSTDGTPAAALVNTFDEDELVWIFRHYGEERRATAAARAIVAARKQQTIETTAQLAALITETFGRGYERGRLHPATRIFQGLRIAVNNELNELAAALRATEMRLREGGRLVVLSFHSLEDRIAKRFLHHCARPPAQERPHAAPSFILPRRGISRPSAREISANRRARSVKMRVGIRTKAAPIAPDNRILEVPASSRRYRRA